MAFFLRGSLCLNTCSSLSLWILCVRFYAAYFIYVAGFVRLPPLPGPGEMKVEEKVNTSILRIYYNAIFASQLLVTQ